jgi:bacitracin transport system permease protein
MPERKDTKDVLTKKDVHEFLWRGRDFELTSLWQRSIFLATFLVIIFTAYLGLWSAVLGRMHDTQAYIS